LGARWRKWRELTQGKGEKWLRLKVELMEAEPGGQMTKKVGKRCKVLTQRTFESVAFKSFCSNPQYEIHFLFWPRTLSLPLPLSVTPYPHTHYTYLTSSYLKERSSIFHPLLGYSFYFLFCSVFLSKCWSGVK
jgi:hypothetical protein